MGTGRVSSLFHIIEKASAVDFLSVRMLPSLWGDEGCSPTPHLADSQSGPGGLGAVRREGRRANPTCLLLPGLHTQ